MSDDPHSPAERTQRGNDDHGSSDGGWSAHADVLDPDHLRERFPNYDDQIVHTQTQPAESADTVPASEVLPDDLADRLGHDLYTHQAEGIDRLREGENVAVATPTASGKTLIYALYVALCKREDPDARAIVCYPTKALARDQRESLVALYDRLGLDLEVAVYDGDTPNHRRPEIREEADVILTNAAGLNVYLAHHTQWRECFGNCALLAIDEAHAASGIHGMHVAWVLRRLRRILDFYDADPRIVCTSATIGNPAEHARRLTGEPHVVVDEDGSPHGRREIAFWKPPLEEDLGEEYSMDEYLGAVKRAGAATGEIVAHLGLHGVQTLAFSRSRQGTELTAKTVEREAGDHPASGTGGGGVADSAGGGSSGYVSVAPYHAGHGKQTRRDTEQRLQSGDLDSVISTSALELGIDVGSVDATVLAGYPGSRQSFWQRLGRSGRGTDDALSVLVGRADAIDQYVLDHPEFLFEEDVENAGGAGSSEPSSAGAYEDAVIDLGNDAVYARHLLAAASELPIDRDDERWFGAEAVPDGEGTNVEDRLDRGVTMWREAGRLVGDLDRSVRYDGPPRPEADVSMYATDSETFQVRSVDGADDLDVAPIGKDRAYREYHPGAVVLHDGTEYEVVEFEEERPQPWVTLQPIDEEVYTKTHSTKSVSDVEPRASRDLGDGWHLKFGVGTVSIHYAHYERRDVQTGDLIGDVRETGLGPIELRTQLTWVEAPKSLRETALEDVPLGDLLSEPAQYGKGQRQYTFLGGLHGAEHAMIELAPLELRLDSSEIGGLSIDPHPETGVPTWFIHDAVDGGIGYARGIYEHADSLVARTREHVAACGCDGVRGCPSCLMDVQCGNRNEPLHRPATIAILSALESRLD
ncbi:DEAD/DEAH box helicase [Salinarchaeum laminariae]|uniref:DEAD/DEAH box helicase n=1 Tax=Salinarchaeum laminariae TaxID=869888 RepID=UPI0020BD68D4|nr:DEAD/DEAH box helicase [Salinarchaeum laminariae]